MNLKYILIALIASFCALACTEDTLDYYSGDNFIHFTPNVDDKVGVEYNFATDGATTETEVDVPIQVRLWGYLSDTDFKYSVAVVSEQTTAAASDYVLSSEQTFKAGEPECEMVIKVKRAKELLATDYKIVISIQNADNHVVAPQKYTQTVVHVIDKLSGKAPAWWSTTTALGSYSDMKFRVLNVYLGKYLSSLENYTTIAFEQEIAQFKLWWKARWAEGLYKYYAADGTTPLYDTIPD